MLLWRNATTNLLSLRRNWPRTISGLKSLKATKINNYFGRKSFLKRSILTAISLSLKSHRKKKLKIGFGLIQNLVFCQLRMSMMMSLFPRANSTSQLFSTIVAIRVNSKWKWASIRDQARIWQKLRKKILLKLSLHLQAKKRKVRKIVK